MDAKNVLGQVRRGQLVLVTAIQGDWLLATAAIGNQRVQGYVLKSAVTRAAPVVAGPTASFDQSYGHAAGIDSGRFNPVESTYIDRTKGYGSAIQRPNSSSGYGSYNQGDYGGSRPNTSGGYGQGYGNSSGGQEYGRPSRPPSVWETPEWESPREIREKRAMGLLR